MTDRSPSKIERRELQRTVQDTVPHPPRVGVLVGVGVAYAGLLQIGLAGSTTDPLVSLFSPAAGFALVACWKSGSWCWPAIAAVAFAVYAANGAPLVAAAILGVGAATGPLVAARALRRVEFSVRLEGVRDGALLLVYGAAVGPAISAVVGATTLGIATAASASSTLGTVVTWLVGDALGVALVAPLAFAWTAPRDTSIAGGRAEAVLLALATLGLTLAVFLVTKRNLAWAAFALVGWSALRFGARGASSIAALVAVVATVGTVSGRVVSSQVTRPENLLASPFVLLSLAVSGLLLSTMWRERRMLHARLLDSELVRAVGEELTGSGVWTWIPARDQVTASDGLHRVFGASGPAQYTTLQDFLNRVHPADRARVHATIEETMRDGASFHCEARIVRDDDSSTRVVESLGRVLRDTEGRPVLAGASCDITERTRVEVELRQANHHLRGLLDASPLAILELDRKGHVRAWSAGAERIFGWKAAEVLGAPNPIVPPEVAHEFDEILGRAFRGEESHGLRQNRITKRGVRLLMRLSCAPVRDHTDAVVSAVTILEDDTAHARLASAVRRSEEELQDLIRAAPVGIYRMTPDGRIVMANHALLALLGYSSAEPLLSTRYRHQLYHDPREREHIESAIAAGADSLAAVVSLRRANGTAVRVQWDARAVRDAAGRVRFLECFVRDLSERVAMEHTLRASRDRLSNLSRQLIDAQEAERRTIARGLHDEVGQTLTAVRLGLISLKGRWPGAQPPRELSDTIAAVDEARHVVLDLALDLRPSILDDLGLEAALRWYADRLGQRAGVQVHVTSRMAEHRLEAHVETVCYRIAQEALTNVMRHANAGAVDVVLAVADQQLELVVADNGDGFDVESSARDPLGTRLGLVGMTERAQLTGGDLLVDSIPGRGTRVTARFPLTAIISDSTRRTPR